MCNELEFKIWHSSLTRFLTLTKWLSIKVFKVFNITIIYPCTVQDPAHSDICGQKLHMVPLMTSLHIITAYSSSSALPVHWHWLPSASASFQRAVFSSAASPCLFRQSGHRWRRLHLPQKSLQTHLHSSSRSVLQSRRALWTCRCLQHYMVQLP